MIRVFLFVLAARRWSLLAAASCISALFPPNPPHAADGGKDAAERQVPEPLNGPPRRGVPGDAGRRARRGAQHAGGVRGGPGGFRRVRRGARAGGGAARMRRRCRPIWPAWRAAGLSARTAARRLSALRQFHRFLLREGVRADDPTSLLDAPRLPRSLPKYLSEQEVDALLAAAGARAGRPRRDRAGGAGDPVRDRPARVRAAGAAAHARWRGDAAVLLIRGKGGKERIVPLSEAAKRAAAALVRCDDAKDGALAVPRPRRATGDDAAGLLPAAEAGGAGGRARPGARVAACAAAFVRLASAGARRGPAQPADCCWATRTSPRRRSTRTCWPSGCSGWSRRIIRWRGHVTDVGAR